MKRKILSILLATMMVSTVLTGCNKDKEKTTESEVKTHDTSPEDAVSADEIVYEDEHIKLTAYKGLATSTVLDYEVTDADIENQVNTDLNAYYTALEAESTEATDTNTTETSTESEETTKTTETTETKTYTVDDLTDDIVAKMTEDVYKTVDEYIEALKKEIALQGNASIKYNVSGELFQKVITNSELIKYEDEDYQKFYDYSDQYYQEYATYMDIDFDTFKKDTLQCANDDAYKELLDEEAKTNCKTQYIIHAISKEEGINITEDDINEQIQVYLDSGSFESKEDVLQYITEEDIKTNLIYDKVLELIYNNAVYVPEETEETTEETTEATTEASVEETVDTPDTTEKTDK